ncbi:MAG: Aminodeoxychorismate synthase component 1 [Cryomorphaceae bacterium]|nr:MAG: Aminodeoxychorismate synthase component 1 [Cryomorphaceae bacterium]
MRFSYTFKVDKPSELIKLLLYKSQSLNYISVLDSNTESNQTSLPADYISYDLIAGVDDLEVLNVDSDSFNALQNFHDKHKDWLFGCLSYDLKNEVEQLTSNNNDGIKAASLSFFIPKYVLLLKGNSLEIQSYESKEDCQQFLAYQQLNWKGKSNVVQLKQRDTKAKYLEKIGVIKKHIQRGDIYEVNYCQEFFSEQVMLNPQQVFLELNTNAKTPFASFLKLNDLHIMCASPERFIKKSGNKIISQPIKGTRKRGIDLAEDKTLIKELIESEKEISENVMIVDLVRNDLSITASKASVKVEELCGIYTFKKVHQMISTISSKVDAKTNFSQILKSVFPMGSMTGVPKLRAMELIEQLEEFKRGVFSGAIGYITPKGDFDFNVVIRTILYNASTKYLSVAVGGAITIKSDANEEYEECLVKVRPIFEVLNFQFDEK